MGINLWVAGKTVIPLTRAIQSALEMSFIIKRCTYLLICVFTFSGQFTDLLPRDAKLAYDRPCVRLSQTVILSKRPHVFTTQSMSFDRQPAIEL